MGISALLAAQILDASATGRSVLTGADAAAIRTTLGLGTLATQSPTGTPSASTFLRGDFSWQTIDLSGYLPLAGGTMTGRLQTPSILLAGNFSATAWTTSGVGLSHTARTLTDTSSTGTVATAYTNVLSGNTIAASNATTFTDYASLFLGSPSAGSNVTITNPFSLITQGAVRIGGAVGINAGTLNGTVLDISQTWGGTGTYTGLKYNVTDSGPANAASLLMDLQVGGSSRFGIRKSNYRMEIGADGNGPLLINMNNGNIGFTGNLTGVYGSFGSFGLSIGGTQGGAGASHLASDAANTLAQRNSTNAQTFRLYNTFTDSSNYERGKIEWSSNVLRIGTEKAGTGSARALELQTDGTTRLTIGTSIILVSSGTDLCVSTWLGFGISGTNGWIKGQSDGVFGFYNNATTGFNRLQFGGTTSSFPSIKRNAAALNFRLADDSGDCDITAKAATFSGNVTVSAVNLVTDTTTGTKIGTATTQKLGFFNATPVVQPTAVANATDAASVITQLNALLSRMRDLGLIAT